MGRSIILVNDEVPFRFAGVWLSPKLRAFESDVVLEFAEYSQVLVSVNSLPWWQKSMSTGPSLSKKTVSISFFADLWHLALTGWRAGEPLGIHSKLNYFDSTSLAHTQLSSLVMTVKSFSGLSQKNDRLSKQRHYQNSCCSWVSSFGTSLGAIFERVKSFLRIV